jgi:hypothetical protein
VDPIAVKVGRIRNAQLTRDRERTHMELDGLEGRVFVLVALPASTALGAALSESYRVLETIHERERGTVTPEALRAEGVL